MLRALRTLLLCLLIAALPLQGWATVAAACDVSAHELIEHGAMPDHHDMQMGMDEHADMPSTADAHRMKNHGGGNCASCCSGIAALPAIAIAAPVVFSSQQAVATPAPFLSTAFPSGLERPPKHSRS
jgi:hypothetical protein